MKIIHLVLRTYSSMTLPKRQAIWTDWSLSLADYNYACMSLPRTEVFHHHDCHFCFSERAWLVEGMIMFSCTSSFSRSSLGFMSCSILFIRIKYVWTKTGKMYFALVRQFMCLLSITFSVLSMYRNALYTAIQARNAAGIINSIVCSCLSSLPVLIK